MQLLPFSNSEAVVRSRGYLPHWEIDDATYFITYRLFDSLPRKTIEQLQREYENLVRLIGDKTAVQRDAVRIRYLRRLNAYLDNGYGECHLLNRAIAANVVNKWKQFDQQLYRLIAWSVMPNHTHVVLRLFRGAHLPRIIRLWKGSTSREANRILNRTAKFWFRDYYDHCVRTERELERTITYVLENPLKVGLTEWPFVGTAG